MVDIQSAAAEIRRGKKEEEERKKPQDENIMVCPIPQGGHKKLEGICPVSPTHFRDFGKTGNHS